MSFNTNATLSNVEILNSINVVQTATNNVDNVTLEKTIVNIEIIDINQNIAWNPSV